MLHKMALWASLAFFGAGEQLQLAVALALCVIRLIIHVRFEPWAKKTDNLFDYVLLVLLTVFCLVGLLVNYLRSVAERARLVNDVDGQADADRSIDLINITLQISIGLAAALGVVTLLRSTVKTSRRMGLTRRLARCTCPPRGCYTWCHRDGGRRTTGGNNPSLKAVGSSMKWTHNPTGPFSSIATQDDDASDEDASDMAAAAAADAAPPREGGGGGVWIEAVTLGDGGLESADPPPGNPGPEAGNTADDSASLLQSPEPCPPTTTSRMARKRTRQATNSLLEAQQQRSPPGAGTLKDEAGSSSVSVTRSKSGTHQIDNPMRR